MSERGLHFLDVTGPYREVVLTRLRELAEMGADGFLFDAWHLPPVGCWGSPLEEAWKAEKGAERLRGRTMGTSTATLTWQKKIEQTFAYWRDEVKAERPDVVFLVSTTTWSRC